MQLLEPVALHGHQCTDTLKNAPLVAGFMLSNQMASIEISVASIEISV